MVYRLTIYYVPTQIVGWPQFYRRSPIKLSGKCYRKVEIPCGYDNHLNPLNDTPIRGERAGGNTD